MIVPTAPRTAVRSALVDPYRVMVVDDSAVIRGLITRMLEEDASVKVVASAGNGKMAISALGRHDVEVAILDIEMPEMDGLTALPELLRINPKLKVIMASTLTQKSAAVSLKALSLGAADYIPKPTATKDVHGSGDFRHDLLEKVIGLAGATRGAPSTPTASQTLVVAEPTDAPLSARVASIDVKLRPPSSMRPTALAVGSSTGGPQALLTFFKSLNQSLGLPVFVTQHMPPSFTTILAEHISNITGGTCREGEDGEVAQPGRIYLAPGAHHMVVSVEGGKRVIRINTDPPENFCRPAVDPMFRSLAKAYGAGVFGVILTGMGSDGAKGGKLITEYGGTIVAQDEETSVVWGMPGAAAAEGICSALYPIDQVAPAVNRFVAQGKL